MSTMVIALDVYGSILMTDDPENCVPARKGFLEFAKKCISQGIILVTSSDNGTELVKIDLKESGVPLEIFGDHFRMTQGQPKDFGVIVRRFGLLPSQLLVIGDRQDLDIESAERQGCEALLIPPYNSLSDDFDWMTLLPMIT